MSLEVILVGLVPLVAFAVLDSFVDPKKAIWAAMFLGLALVGYFSWRFQELDHSMLGEALLIVVAGAVALRMNKPALFKYQPAVLGVIFAAFLAWFQIFDTPYLVKLVPQMAKILPDAKVFLENRQVLEALARVSGQLIFVFLVHAAVMAAVAYRFGNLIWILARLAIYPVVVAVMILNMTPR